MKGQFGPAGALFDGWETRRHNPAAYDWAIVRLGPRAGAELSGFDIDTANFNGNEGPEAEVWGLCLDADEERNGAAIAEDDERVRVCQQVQATALPSC
jgi:allantoicase